MSVSERDHALGDPQAPVKPVEYGDYQCPSKVHDDTVWGVRSGVSNTPTYFLNGVRYDGPVDADAFSQAIERAGADHAGRPEYLPPQTSLHNGRRDGH